MSDPSHWSRSLGAWLARDLVLVAGFVWIWLALRAWHAGAGHAASAAALSVSAFVLTYATCYIAHEWGHDAGARLSGARVPRGSIAGILLPLFDPGAHTRRQFLWLSLGGVIAYLATAAVILGALQPELAYRAAAVGALAFVAQSLSVDLPVIRRVQRGGDILAALREGVNGPVILRRTLGAWSVLALLLLGLYGLGGGDA